ncbi:hypothetical protein CER18_09790, partial [Bartonella tribocorum]
SFKDGGLTQPIYQLSDVSKDGQVTGKSFTDVGSAFSGLDTNIKNVNDRIKEVSQGVAQDSLSWSKDDNAFVAKHGEKEGSKTNSKITHILDGNIASGSTDAVTGGQLYSLNNTLANYFGGGAKYENGEWTDPNFKVKQIGSDGDITEESYKNVAEALTGVGSSFKSVHDEISTMISNSLVKQDATTNL